MHLYVLFFLNFLYLYSIPASHNINISTSYFNKAYGLYKEDSIKYASSIEPLLVKSLNYNENNNEALLLYSIFLQDYDLISSNKVLNKIDFTKLAYAYIPLYYTNALKLAYNTKDYKRVFDLFRVMPKSQQLAQLNWYYALDSLNQNKNLRGVYNFIEEYSLSLGSDPLFQSYLFLMYDQKKGISTFFEKNNEFFKKINEFSLLKALSFIKEDHLKVMLLSKVYEAKNISPSLIVHLLENDLLAEDEALNLFKGMNGSKDLKINFLLYQNLKTPQLKNDFLDFLKETPRDFYIDANLDNMPEILVQYNQGDITNIYINSNHNSQADLHLEYKQGIISALHYPTHSLYYSNYPYLEKAIYKSPKETEEYSLPFYEIKLPFYTEENLFTNIPALFSIYTQTYTLETPSKSFIQEYSISLDVFKENGRIQEFYENGILQEKIEHYNDSSSTSLFNNGEEYFRSIDWNADGIDDILYKINNKSIYQALYSFDNKNTQYYIDLLEEKEYFNFDNKGSTDFIKNYKRIIYDLENPMHSMPTFAP